MRIISVVNQKGGCGKTTISINLASTLAEMGKKTLLIDMDPQSHCAVGLAVPEEQIEQSIYDVLISKSRNEPIRLSEIVWQISDGFELAPSSIDLSAFDQQMAGIPERECCLKEVLKETGNEYEYAVIDCPPAVGLLTFNALRASTEVIVPVETGYFSLHGLSRQLETLNILCERSGHKIEVRVVASMYDIRTKMAREIMGELRSCFGDKMFKTVINFNTKIKEATSFGQPIIEYDPASKGRSDFRALADEVISASRKQQRHELINSLSSELSSISKSAEELMSTSKAASAKSILAARTEKTAVTSMPSNSVREATRETVSERADVSRAEAAKSKGMDEKLAEYYGVSQINDAIVFVTLYPRAQKVQIAGDFNNWQPEKTEMEKVGTSGVWQAKLKLPSGKHQYRFVVDGQWQQDPYNEHIEANPFGGFNSILEVK